MYSICMRVCMYACVCFEEILDHHIQAHHANPHTHTYMQTHTDIAHSRILSVPFNRVNAWKRNAIQRRENTTRYNIHTDGYLWNGNKENTIYLQRAKHKDRRDDTHCTRIFDKDTGKDRSLSHKMTTKHINARQMAVRKRTHSDRRIRKSRNGTSADCRNNSNQIDIFAQYSHLHEDRKWFLTLLFGRQAPARGATAWTIASRHGTGCERWLRPGMNKNATRRSSNRNLHVHYVIIEGITNINLLSLVF